VFIRVAAFSAGRESTHASQEPEKIQLKERPGKSPASTKMDTLKFATGKFRASWERELRVQRWRTS